MSASTRSRTTTVRQDELEERLVKYQEDAYKKVETKLDQLIELFNHHITSEGHELTTRRVKAVEDELAQQQERPIKTWEVIAGIIGLLFTLCFLFMSGVNTVISVILFFHTFVH